MKQQRKRLTALCGAVLVLASALLSLGLTAAADGFTPSEKRVPDNVTLTPIANFDEGLGDFIGGNAGDTGEGSVPEHTAALGYGESGGAVKWTYNKDKANWNAPSLRDSTEAFYKGGDGLFVWLKAEAAGTARIEGLMSDWTTTIHCDVAYEAGENLLYFPWSEFVKNADGSKAGTDTVGCHMSLYLESPAPRTGTVYVDALSTYVKTPEIPTVFTPSEKRVPDNVTLTPIADFDGGLGTFVGGNAGDTGEGSVPEHTAALGYGESGGAVKWTYNKDKANWNAPSLRDSTETFYKGGDGLFVWLKAEAAGTARIEGLMSDWTTTIHCDVAYEAGENLLYFPWSEFVKNADGSKAGTDTVGCHMSLYLESPAPRTGTVYVDALSMYSVQKTPQEHKSEYHKGIDDFNGYADAAALLGVWSARNAGAEGTGAILSLDTTEGCQVSGQSLKLQYNTKNADWWAPGAIKLKPDNQDFEGDGFCFWIKTEKAMSLRVSYLTEDCEVVYDVPAADLPAGYEGYIHVPYDAVTYLQAGIETPYDEIGFVPSDFYYFTIYCYGTAMWQEYENTVWLDDLSFYSERSFEPAAATVSDVTLNGDKDAAAEAEVTVRLTGDTFRAMEAGADVTAWFNLPQGLTASVKEAVAEGAAELTVTIRGTVEQAAGGVLKVTVPAEALTGGEAVTAEENPNAVIRVSGASGEPENPVPAGEALPTAAAALAAAALGLAVYFRRRAH